MIEKEGTLQRKACPFKWVQNYFQKAHLKGKVHNVK